MLIITECKRVCFACPSSWDCKTDDGKNVHIKYRYGKLTVWIHNENILGNNDIVFRQRFGDSLDGVMDYDTMRKLLVHKAMFVCDETGMTEDPNIEYPIEGCFMK